MTRLVRAVVAHVDGSVTDHRFDDRLETWQGLVHGCIEAVPLTRSAHAYANDSGLIDGLPVNVLATQVVRLLRAGDLTYPLCGAVVFLGTTVGGNEADCPARIADIIHYLAAEADR